MIRAYIVWGMLVIVALVYIEYTGWSFSRVQEQKDTAPGVRSTIGSTGYYHK